MRSLLFKIGFLIVITPCFVWAGPAGPPAGNPILNSSIYQRGSIMNVDTATIRSVNLSTFSNTPSLPFGITINGATYNSLGYSAGPGQFFNVQSYGAKGDGVTDDSAAIQALINSMGSGTLFFPAGTYRCSVTLGSADIKVQGVGLGTKFIPIDNNTHFVFNVIHSFTGLTHVFADFQIVGFPGPFGRGIYLNDMGFNDFKNVRFDTLGFGVYANSVEWDRFEQCDFMNNTIGVFSSNLASDILGNGPIQTSQNAAEQFFVHCRFWSNTCGFYWDNFEDLLGDANSGNAFLQCEFINNSLGIGSGDGGQKLYQSLDLRYCWFNNNGTSSFQTINGYTVLNGGISVTSGSINLNNVLLSDKFSFLGDIRVVGKDVHFTGSTVANISTSSVVNIDGIVADQNGGSVFDLIEGRNLQCVAPGRPAMIRLPSARTAFTHGQFTNVLTTGYTTTCAVGTVPPVNAGSPTLSFYHGDGLYANTCLKVSGVANDGIRWSGAFQENKWYVTTFSIRADTDTTIDTTNSSGYFSGNGILNLTTKWRTFGAIGQSAVTGTAYIVFTLDNATPVYISCIQVCEFESQQDALNYFNSDTYALASSEVNNRQNSGSSIPASGTWTVGDVYWNSAVSTGTNVGWVNITAGTPGSWLKFGQADPFISSMTLSSIQASTATIVGQSVYCSNCASTTVCVSTGTTKNGQYAASGQAPTTKCQ